MRARPQTLAGLLCFASQSTPSRRPELVRLPTLDGLKLLVGSPTERLPPERLYIPSILVMLAGLSELAGSPSAVELPTLPEFLALSGLPALARLSTVAGLG